VLITEADLLKNGILIVDDKEDNILHCQERFEVMKDLQ